MKAPSFEAASSCSGRRLVTSVTIAVLSSGQSLRRAVVCITAVRKDCGLNSPDSHTLFGVVRSEVHLRGHAVDFAPQHEHSAHDRNCKAFPEAHASRRRITADGANRGGQIRRGCTTT